MTTNKKPAVQNELDKAQAQFDAFDADVKAMTLDRMNQAPVAETEPQTKLSSREIAASKDVYLKPERTIGARDKFNERFKEEYEFAKQYVHFIAENKEIIGEAIEIWTRPYGGLPAEFWRVPVNKPVWGPRYLAEQIRKKVYHRLVMQPASTGADSMGQYYGSMAVDTTIHRLNAEPVIPRKSVFIGKEAFAA
jgi:hypothetical protein